MIAIIESLKAFAPNAFRRSRSTRIVDVTVVVDDEPRGTVRNNPLADVPVLPPGHTVKIHRTEPTSDLERLSDLLCYGVNPFCAVLRGLARSPAPLPLRRQFPPAVFRLLPP
ncbi:hypothetical protein MRS76_15495 [Rhizobiaceae bacterium n13]|uniref:hypothetical protein n=1 Tax=Ferirhizobium litorale TaxID=2927786 RepID=UPI0024B2C8DA|nr:hypothetical protein [Fererhizobium litorale]MDI7863359.1 hypothetical protein [Fererhizobium litorale]